VSTPFESTTSAVGSGALISFCALAARHNINNNMDRTLFFIPVIIFFILHPPPARHTGSTMKSKNSKSARKNIDKQRYLILHATTLPSKAPPQQAGRYFFYKFIQLPGFQYEYIDNKFVSSQEIRFTP
jgi:hypothetical protein